MSEFDTFGLAQEIQELFEISVTEENVWDSEVEDWYIPPDLTLEIKLLLDQKLRG